MAQSNGRDRELRERAEAVIPGGVYGQQATRLLPDDYPQFFSRAKGAMIWDPTCMCVPGTTCSCVRR